MAAAVVAAAAVVEVASVAEPGLPQAAVLPALPPADVVLTAVEVEVAVAGPPQTTSAMESGAAAR